MVALLPPYVETAPQLCEFEGSEIDDFGSKFDGFGVNNKKATRPNLFFLMAPSGQTMKWLNKKLELKQEKEWVISVCQEKKGH